MGKRPRKWLAAMAKRHQRIIEVGVWKGKTTQILARNTRGRVWAVDHWMGTPHDPDQHALYEAAVSSGRKTVRREFMRNLHDYITRGRVHVVDMDSAAAAEHLFEIHGPSFDMVFIDADHSYEACARDIAAYRQCLRSGGLLCGHDYKESYPGVMRAVDEAFGGAAIVGPASIWSVNIT